MTATPGHAGHRRRLAAAAVLLAALVAPGCGVSRGKALAECVAGTPLPGLQLVQGGGHFGRSIYYYIHARLGPGDLARILAAEPYKPLPAGRPLPDYKPMKLEPWWDPARLGPGLVAHAYVVSVPGDEVSTLWAKSLYTNARGDEVYIFKGYGY